MDVCTVIAKNYLPAARVLADSLAEHHPGVRLHVLVIDEWEGYIDPARERFEIVDPADDRRARPRADALALHRARVLHGGEAVAAAPPARARRRRRDRLPGPRHPPLRADRRRLRRGARARPRAQPAQHGPDAARRPQAERAGHPHRGRVQPRLPRAARRPTSARSCSTGGASGSRPTASSTRSAASSSTSAGWTSCRAWREDFHLVRDPGFNVAYWNLGSRTLARAEDGGRARRRRAAAALPLQRLPRRQAAQPQHAPGPDPARRRPGARRALRRLRAGAARRGLRRREGLGVHVEHAPRPAWPIDRTMRLAYREARRGGRRRPARCSTPTASASSSSGPALPAATGGRHGVTRYQAALYELRPDLEAAYPDLDDAEVASGFLGWVRVHGAAELGIPEALLPPAPPPAPARPSASTGPLVPPLGVERRGLPERGARRRRGRAPGGERARRQRRAAAPRRAPRPEQPRRPRLRRLAPHHRAVRRPTSSASTPTGCPRSPSRPGRRSSTAATRSASGGGSSAEFPEQWHGAFDLVDEIWAGSRFVADALSEVAPVPVLVMPLPLAPGPPAAPATARASASTRPRSRSSSPTTTTASSSARTRSAPSPRSGPRSATTRACSSSSSASTTTRTRSNHDRLRIAIEGAPNIRLIAGYLDRRPTSSC